MGRGSGMAALGAAGAPVLRHNAASSGGVEQYRAISKLSVTRCLSMKDNKIK